MELPSQFVASRRTFEVHRALALRHPHRRTHDLPVASDLPGAGGQ